MRRRGFVADEGDGHDAVGALVEAGGFEVEDDEGAVEVQARRERRNGIFSHGRRMAQRAAEEKQNRRRPVGK